MATLVLRLSLVGVEGKTDTKESFWNEYRRMSGYESRRFEGRFDDDYLEGFIFGRFQARLNSAVRQHFGLGFHDRPERTGSPTPLDLRRLTLRITRIEYSSLELFVDVLGLNDGVLLPIIAAALEIYAPEELSGALPGNSVPFKPTVHPAEWSEMPLPPNPQPQVPDTIAPENSGRLNNIQKIWQIANLSLLMPVLLSLGLVYFALTTLSDHEKEISMDREGLRSQTTSLINAMIERNNTLEGALKDVLASSAQAIRDANRMQLDQLKERVATTRQAMSGAAERQSSPHTDDTSSSGR